MLTYFGKANEAARSAIVSKVPTYFVKYYGVKNSKTLEEFGFCLDECKFVGYGDNDTIYGLKELCAYTTVDAAVTSHARLYFYVYDAKNHLYCFEFRKKAGSTDGQLWFEDSLVWHKPNVPYLAPEEEDEDEEEEEEEEEGEGMQEKDQDDEEESEPSEVDIDVNKSSPYDKYFDKFELGDKSGWKAYSIDRFFKMHMEEKVMMRGRW